ncbi:MAG TPA: SRPBCC family protein [Gemmatimonadaceae bacterium]
MNRLLRFWFTFDLPVNPALYLRHGLALMLLKYLGDAAIIWIFAGIIWTPLDYLVTGASFSHSKLRGQPSALMQLLALWTLPFLWIGLTMSVRRCIDAGRSAWLSLLFFVPVVNYAFMLLMSVLPTAPLGRPLPPAREHERRLPSALLAIAVGALIGLSMLTLSVVTMQSYGASLFFGLPFVIGVVTAYLFNRRYAASAADTAEVVFATIGVIGGAAWVIGAEGAVCLLMALPFAAGLALLGGIVGRRIALWDGASPANAVLAVVLLPIAPFLDSPASHELHEVRSAIEINAPVDKVWERVISFPPLPEPSELVFRAGIAYPRRARLVGTGVGAVRYCEFSTGPFVEPITAWEPGRRLSFDVVKQPPPLRELSLYSSISPPHLHGYFRARRGEFRIVPLAGGRTRLEGTTWYELRIEPEAYWSFYADWMVSSIHHRVLDHIKRVSEADKVS